MRRWAYDGVDVMAIKKADRPKGWFLHDVTKGKFFDDDVPLYANPKGSTWELAMTRAAVSRKTQEEPR